MFGADRNRYSVTRLPDWEELRRELPDRRKSPIKKEMSEWMCAFVTPLQVLCGYFYTFEILQYNCIIWWINEGNFWTNSAQKLWGSIDSLLRHTHTHESILNLTIEHKLFSNSVDALNTKLLPAGSRHWFRSCGCLTKTVVVVEKSTVADPKKKKYNTPVVQQF